MTMAHFVLKAGSTRPYSAGRGLARERVISQSRSYRQLVLCNKIKQKRSKGFREAQISLRKRKMLPMLCQTTAWAKIHAYEERYAGCIGAIDWLNKPIQMALFELDNRLKEHDSMGR